MQVWVEQKSLLPLQLGLVVGSQPDDEPLQLGSVVGSQEVEAAEPLVDAVVGGVAEE